MENREERAIGVIGGSGIYRLEGLEGRREIHLETPFGKPSDVFVEGWVGQRRCVFLARHGRYHSILPHEINYRANIWGMKKLGVEFLISVSAVGSMREEICPGDLVFPDQLFDRTRQRPSSFFGEGVVAHVSFGDPFCMDLLELLYRKALELGYRSHRGGTYLCIEGPQFSTKAESRIYRQWGVDVIGMTNLQEAKLAREAEICMATVALVTDYDCWHQEEGEVNVESVLEVMRANVEKAQRLILEVVGEISGERSCGCGRSLDGAIMTPREAIPAQTYQRLSLLIEKYFQNSQESLGE
ncbi:MAG: S-methyl-5'-thioadenosine phosphorylase [Planctomycetota bacterium]|nr:MAG: S-methyl-5'-thioadenosine phosphorylase [Planctomycetota bacterium]